MNIKNIIKAFTFTILISALYAAFQHYCFDMDVILPIAITLIIAIKFTRLVKLSKPKMIIFSLLIGLTMYITFIGVGYELFRYSMRQKLPAQVSSSFSQEQIIDNVIIIETGRKGIIGYMIYRTHSVPLTMKWTYERAEAQGLKRSYFQGVIGEVLRFFIMIFMPLLTQLQPRNNKFRNA